MSVMPTIDAVLDHGLEIIHGLTKIRGPKADIALAAIGAIVVTLRDGLSGSIAPEIIAADLTVLMKSISDDDAAADAALREKFAEVEIVEETTLDQKMPPPLPEVDE